VLGLDPWWDEPRCQRHPEARQTAQKAYVRCPRHPGRLALPGVQGAAAPRSADCVLRPLPSEALARDQGQPETPKIRAAPRDATPSSCLIVQPVLRSGGQAAKKARKTVLGQSCSRRRPAELLTCHETS
jgi:hypothetical protein